MNRDDYLLSATATPGGRSFRRRQQHKQIN